MKILLLDTETTELDNPRLVQLAYQHTVNGMDYTEVNELFKPPTDIDFGAMAVHHITNEMVADKPPFEGSPQDIEVTRMLDEGYIFVAHNAPFDIKVMKTEGVNEPKYYVDTKRCAMHLVQTDYHNLQYLRYALNLDLNPDKKEVVQERAHDAAGDVTVLKALFNHLMELADKALADRPFYPNATVEEREKASLTHLINLSRQPTLVRIAKFGKYRGQAWSEIAGNDMGYLKWMQGKEMEKDEADRDMDLLHTLARYIQ